MGGTRCIFRDCHVSTQRYPKMHFFKLPIRDPVRLEAWLKNCGNAEILNVAREKLSNRAVCARHFRYECFMNFKLDRLVPNQIPTLIRVNKELAWDVANLDENGEPTMVKLSPTLIHLIPPVGFECPLGFSKDQRFVRKYVKRQTSPKPLPRKTNSKKPKIMNRLEHEESIETGVSQIIDLTMNPAEIEQNVEVKVEQDLIVEKKAKVEQLVEAKAQLELIDERVSPTCISEINDSAGDMVDPVEPNHPANKNLDDLQLRFDELKANFEQISLENADLKKTVDDLKIKIQACTTQSQTCSASSAPPLSKPQLYKGIQRYLSPAMSALVRMEMFGGGERAWKNDERDFAKELLQLGEHVYTHCCDEWRFRLPSLRQARIWLNEKEIPQAEADDL